MKKRTIVTISGILLVLVGLLLPAENINPVKNASAKDWNSDSFWYEPWGSSGVHKGVDIFAESGTELRSASTGIVLYQGFIKKGGNVIVVLGAKWRLYYYAHLESIEVNTFDWVSKGQKIGAVGDTGNAKGKPPHLHYSMVTLIPYFWRYTNETQGWKKMFYLNPEPYLNKSLD